MAFVVPYVIMSAVSAATYYVMMSGMKVEGMKLGDIAKQTAQEGGARIIVWGIVRPIGGNIIACSEPRKVTTSQGGKGGSPETTSESVYRTYAIGICEGPITGIRRVWRNNKLVYDSRGNDWGTANNGIFLQKATFYLGDYTQLPDPTLEAVFGVGNVPAHRGTCYMVMNNEDLTELGGAVPQYIFEVERAEGLFLTSKPYALESTESAGSTGIGISEGVLRRYLEQYDDGIESVETVGLDVTDGVLRIALIEYEDGLPESVETTGLSISEGYHGTS